MTDALDLAAIEARANAAAKGPWRWRANDKGYPQEIVANDDGLVLVAETYTGPEHFPAEAEFIAHARTDVPALIAKVREQEAAMDYLAGHDRAGLDHLDEAMEACTERDNAEAVIRKAIGQTQIPLSVANSPTDVARQVGWNQAMAAVARILAEAELS